MIHPFCGITLDKDYGHYLRAILCLLRPDFPQTPSPTDFSRINDEQLSESFNHHLYPGQRLLY